MASYFILKIDKHIRLSHKKNVKTENDIAALIELLKIEAEHWPRSRADNVSLSDLFCRDQTLFEMWPEACRRTGVRRRQFPPGVIRLWKKSLGRIN